MIKKTLMLAGLSALAFVSCQKDPPPLTGIYSFETLSGQYAEVWIDAEKLAIVKADPAQTGFFYYKLKDDTLRMFRNQLDLQNNKIADRLYIKSQSDSVLQIVQDAYQNRLRLITRQVPRIDKESQDFVAAQRKDYSRRMK